jgi:hypothetical protein
MNVYTWFNIIIAAALMPASFYAIPASRRLRGTQLSVRSATLMALTAFPWDYFGVQQGAWRYPLNPGLIIYGVPVNDLLLIWVGTHFSCSIFYAAVCRPYRGKRHSENKHAHEQHV